MQLDRRQPSQRRTMTATLTITQGGAIVYGPQT